MLTINIHILKKKKGIKIGKNIKFGMTQIKIYRPVIDKNDETNIYTYYRAVIIMKCGFTRQIGKHMNANVL